MMRIMSLLRCLLGRGEFVEYEVKCATVGLAMSVGWANAVCARALLRYALLCYLRSGHGRQRGQFEMRICRVERTYLTRDWDWYTRS